MSTEVRIMQEVAPRSYQMSTPMAYYGEIAEVTVTRSGRSSPKLLCYRNGDVVVVA